MEKIQKFTAKYLLLIILALSIPAVWALFIHGFYGASDDLHIGWLYEMDRVIDFGKFPPRFVPDLSFGYGYPLFNFVFPLPFYIGEIFYKLGLTFVDSIKAVFVLSIPLSMFFMYKFLKEHTGEILALAGAVLYTYTPYRATDIYVRGSIGEILAFVFPPLAAYAISKIGKEKSARWIGLLALATAGLILSHNIMAYMFVPFLALFALWQGREIMRSIYGFVLGLLVSIYFWLPAIVESKLMKYDTVFNFIDHFPTLKQLITPYFGYGASVPGPYDGISFFLGAVNIALIVCAFVLVKKLNKVAIWALVMIAVSVFMMNYRSTFVWNLIPLLPYFQFPWRFLSLTTFATSILVIIFDKVKFGKIIGILIIITAIYLNFIDFKPHDFLGRTDEYFINRYIPYPVASAEYRRTGEEYLRLPVATEIRPDKISPNPGLDATFKVNYTKETTFDYFKYYFPGWKAWIDGKKIEVYAGKPYGQVEFSVPAGRHEVKVAFRETPFRGALDLISLFGLIFAVVIIVKPDKKR
ncbi:MAG: glycosyltransferase family 39 protein [Candidatus Woesebacteria bacterium]|nr:glycosyltransferase family 39 protein [Candidatus Woesebacteria bacterium]